MRGLSYVGFALLLLLLLLPASVAAQRDFSQVEIKATRVAGNVYMLNGTGGNVGVSVGEDGILIVDDKFAPLADKIRAALQGIGKGELRFILNTHWHHDHTGANEVFGPEATIIAHSNVRKRLMTEQQIRGNTYPALPKEAWPVITFDQGVSIHFNGEEIKAIHLPSGHTDGDTVVLFTGSSVVHMGDDYFAGRFPFVDLKAGGDVEGLTRNIKTVLDAVPPQVKIIPGHGPISTPDDLRGYHRMLVETTNIVRKRMAAGASLEKIKSQGLPEKWAEWGTGFISSEAWLETIYRSLSREPGN
jgi:glyoxylase-like metal-dependent hydrolase (beta-lactamase superfamily II)